MKNFNKLLALLALAALAACENELPFDVVQQEIVVEAEQDKEFVPYDGMIKLGKQLENPYSVTNMQKAFEMLPPESRGAYTVDDIQPTHLYVKFKPANVDELDMLFWSNDDIHFYSYPLDYERETGGYYRDPSLPEDVPTYYYASIPIQRQIPNECDYEILEELYIPDELTEYTRTLAPSFVNAIVKQSFELTNNEYEGVAVETRSDGQTRASYTYSGRIRVYDQLMQQYVPVPGALIKCTRWFTTVTALTNTNGYYTMTRESQNEYTYAIYWERDNQYDIRDGELNQAVSDGPTQVAGWSIDIGTGSPRGINYATIGRAAYRYFYGNTGGLNRATPMNWGDLKICYMHTYHEENWSGYFSPQETLVEGNIFIYQRYSDGTIISTHNLLATTIHEMGHSTQCAAMRAANFRDVDDLLKESWAKFVQGYLTYIEYGELGAYDMTNFSFENYCDSSDYRMGIGGALQWPKVPNKYSCLVIDLYDDFNQRVEWSDQSSLSNVTLPNDVITGYSPSVLNTMINQCYDIEDVRTYLKVNKPTGVTNSMIDTFINFFIDNYEAE